MKKKNGISRRSILVSLAATLSVSALASAYAVVAGTVFRNSGLAFSGVEVELLPANPSKKNKRQTSLTNNRGEFAFRVPAAEMEYTLGVKPGGYRPELKRVKIVGDERIEQNFLLDPSPKEK